MVFQRSSERLWFLQWGRGGLLDSFSEQEGDVSSSQLRLCDSDCVQTSCRPSSSPPPSDQPSWPPLLEPGETSQTPSRPPLFVSDLDFDVFRRLNSVSFEAFVDFVSSSLRSRAASSTGQSAAGVFSPSLCRLDTPAADGPHRRADRREPQNLLKAGCGYMTGEHGSQTGQRTPVPDAIFCLCQAEMLKPDIRLKVGGAVYLLIPHSLGEWSSRRAALGDHWRSNPPPP